MKELKAFFATLLAALDGDAALTALLTAANGGTLPSPSPIYLDNAPPDTPGTYLTYNDAADDSWDTSDTRGARLLIDVHCWSDKPARLEAVDIIARVEDLADDPAWTVSGFTLVHCRPLRSRCEPLDPGFHAMTTLDVIIGHG